jgi:hypothetical protein
VGVFDPTRPIYVLAESVHTTQGTYPDHLHIAWVNAPFNRSSWNSGGETTQTNTILITFNPKLSFNQAPGAKPFKTSLQELQNRTIWEFRLCDETMNTAVSMVDASADIRSYCFTLCFWQE